MVDDVSNRQVLDRIAAALGISVFELYSPATRKDQKAVDPALREATIAQLQELAAQGAEPKPLILELLKVLESTEE